MFDKKITNEVITEAYDQFGFKSETECLTWIEEVGMTPDDLLELADKQGGIQMEMLYQIPPRLWTQALGSQVMSMFRVGMLYGMSEAAKLMSEEIPDTLPEGGE